MIGDGQLVSKVVSRIRERFSMLPGILLDAVSLPEEEVLPEDDGLEQEMEDEVTPELPPLEEEEMPEIQPELPPEEDKLPKIPPGYGLDLVQSQTTDYIEVVETDLSPSVRAVETWFYNHITGKIHQTTIITSQHDPSSRWPEIYSDALSGGLITQTQYDNGIEQLRNLGY